MYDNHIHFTTVAWECNTEYEQLQEFLLEILKCPMTTISIWKKKKKTIRVWKIVPFRWDCFFIVEWLWSGGEGRRNEKNVLRKHHDSFFVCRRWAPALAFESAGIPKTQSGICSPTAWACDLCQSRREDPASTGFIHRASSIGKDSLPFWKGPKS